MIKLVNVNKYYNRHKKNEIHVIDNTTLDLPDTGLVTLLGSSGCGKTTLLNAVGGLDKINKGKIIINGTKLSKKNNYKVDKFRTLNIGYIFQDYYLLDDLTVYENISLALKMIGIKNKSEIKKRVDYVLESVNMYRYRNRLACNLSGGERQRVGIARALVKNPNIIIADEPTGNLDSKNTLEIMNIIKTISKSRLVLLVTHEKDIAQFYSSRIIEIQDGKVISDIENKHNNNLDYRLENEIYLKDFKNKESINENNLKIDYYNDKLEKLNLQIVIKNNNIYIKTSNKERIEVVDEDSNIEFINDTYKQIDKKIYEDYNYNLDEICNNKKTKYSSIYNPFNSLINGLKKIRDYTFIKKILLLGFFFSAMFTVYALSTMFASVDIKDKEFMEVHKDYLYLPNKKISVKNYLEYESNENVVYGIPGDSKVSFTITNSDYFQTNISSMYVTGSLASKDLVTQNNLIVGTLPTNEYEVLIDKMIIDELFEEKEILQYGFINYESFIDKNLKLETLKDLKISNDEYLSFKITGVTESGSPSIYTSENMFTNIIANSENSYDYVEEDIEISPEINILDYNLVKDTIKIKKGRLPENDYEVIVNYDESYEYRLNKECDIKVNGKKLKVVGYYTTNTDLNKKLVSNNTIKYNNIVTKDGMTIYSKDMDKTLTDFETKNIKLNETYDLAKKNYIKEMREGIISKLIVSLVILAISIIEIYLMMRSSFLSRIKEVGILRAIGMKKRDIYKMFLGEVMAISLIVSTSGILFMSYIIKELRTVAIIKDSFVLNYKVILLSILITYLSNIIFGVFPVKLTLRKSPSEIIKRNDFD